MISDAQRPHVQWLDGLWGRYVRIGMDHESEIVCQRCGKCCLADFIAYVTDEDIERWRREGRNDILSMIRQEHAVWMGDHLISSEDGHYLHGCSFLSWKGDHSFCGIYSTRPRVCRRYQPGSSEICPRFALRRSACL